MVKYVADLHMHTIACGHAYSTIRELAEEASVKKLKLIAVTEHGPAHDPKGTSLMFFATYRDIPDYLYDVRILKGCEANVISVNGELDIPEKILKNMDIVIASFHSSTTPKEGIEKNTERMINAMQNPYVDIIGHPDNIDYPVDAEEIAKSAVKYNVALEVNDSSQAARPGSDEQCKRILFYAKEHGAVISIGSDAHSQFKVGDVSHASKLVGNAGIPENQILNVSIEKVIKFLKRKNNKKHLN